MKILRSSHVKEVDAYTIENEPILSINLMERAAGKCSGWMLKHIEKHRKFFVFAGPGNNGGDGIAVARQLAANGREVTLFLVKISDKLSTDAQVNLERIYKQGAVSVHEIEKNGNLPQLPEGSVVVDGLFGSGLNRPLEGFPADVVKHLNTQSATRIAIDIPSGLFGEDNSGNDFGAIFRADYTLTFQFPALSFFFPEHEPFVGDWKVFSIGLSQEKIDEMESPYFLVTENHIREHIKKRLRFAHKGDFGHVLMICGGYGKMGAAVLASRAALKTGSGLVTAHVPKLGYEIMQTAAPEVMMSIDISDIIFSQVPDLSGFTTVGTGPGLGMRSNTKKALENLLEKSDRPLVLDADALNILAEHRELLDKLPENSILTPHPKEFERLTRKVNDHYSRIQLQQEFAQSHKVVLVLKGGNTSIAMPDGTVFFNTTGDPGMATAGSGDVLTGVVTSLLGQSYTSTEAAVIGVYIHGLAGNLASSESSMEAVTASDIIQHLGNAFKTIRNEKT